MFYWDPPTSRARTTRTRRRNPTTTMMKLPGRRSTNFCQPSYVSLSNNFERISPYTYILVSCLRPHIHRPTLFPQSAVANLPPTNRPFNVRIWVEIENAVCLAAFGVGAQETVYPFVEWNPHRSAIQSETTRWSYVAVWNVSMWVHWNGEWVLGISPHRIRLGM